MQEVELNVKLIVPASQCGPLIGKGGSKIKEIRDMTGASMQVAGEMLPSSSERVVNIAGSAESVLDCIYEICLILLSVSNHCGLFQSGTCLRSPFNRSIYSTVTAKVPNSSVPTQFRFTRRADHFCRKQSVHVARLYGCSHRRCTFHAFYELYSIVSLND